MISEISYKQTKLRITSDRKNHGGKALDALIECYRILESYFIENPLFQSSIEPVSVPKNAPKLILEMSQTSTTVGVGPMATVAGAIAQYVGENILASGSKSVIVENGGDIFLKINNPKTIRLFAGDSVFSNKIGFNIHDLNQTMGICTSAGNVGHSTSFGNADAVVVFSKSAILSDASATFLANKVGVEENHQLIEYVKKIPEIDGFVIIQSDQFFSYGNIPEITAL